MKDTDCRLCKWSSDIQGSKVNPARYSVVCNNPAVHGIVRNDPFPHTPNRIVVHRWNRSANAYMPGAYVPCDHWEDKT